MANRKLEIKLLALGRRLLEPPSDVNELLLLLDEVENCLLRVSQSPSQPILAAVGLSRDALILKEILRHSDIDVKVAVSSCVSELTRITAPEAPYNDDLMKEIFQIIVSSFENLSDTASRSYSKRLLILENMAKLRSCVMMLDLECDDLILEMFQHFLNTIRDYHADHVFTSMETIMTLVLEESEVISPELLSCLLASVEKVNQDVSPLAYKLGEKVITCCGDKLKPYLQREVQSKGINLMKYSEIIATVCQEVSDIVAYRDPSVSNSQLGQPQEKKKITGVNGETEIPGALSEFKGSLLSNQMEEQTPEVAYIHSEEPKATLNLEKKKRNDSTKTITLGDTNVDETVLCTNEISKKELSVNKENKTRLRIRTLDAEKGITGESSKKKLTAMNKNASKVSTRSGRQLEETLATKSKRRRGPAMDEASEIVLDEKFVGSRIKVWWPEDKKFYKGTVDAFDPFEKKHMIIYDDGEEEILLLKDEIWELVKDGNVSVGEQEPNNSNHHPSSEMPQKKKAKKTRVSSSKRAEVDTTSKRGEAASAKTFEGDGANIGGKVKGSDANTPGTKSKDSGRKTRTKSVGNIMASKTIDVTPKIGHKSTVGDLKIRSKPEIETTSKAESQAGSGILKIGGKSKSCGTSSSKGKSLSSLRVREDSVKAKSPMKAYKKRAGLKKEQ